jgi:hypothetical protein
MLSDIQDEDVMPGVISKMKIQKEFRDLAAKQQSTFEQLNVESEPEAETKVEWYSNKVSQFIKEINHKYPKLHPVVCRIEALLPFLLKSETFYRSFINLLKKYNINPMASLMLIFPILFGGRLLKRYPERFSHFFAVTFPIYSSFKNNEKADNSNW